MKLNTDAHAIIAGYYKQVYEAVELLTTLSDDDDTVGLECGADVACFFKDGTFSAREIKFYKNKFHRSSPEICKTIYNFYVNSYEASSLFFSSNSGISEKNFYNNWNLSEKTLYIIQCLLRHNRTTSDYYKKAIDDYKPALKVFQSNLDYLAQEIYATNEIARTYMYVNNSISFENLAKNLTFKFENFPKENSMSAIKRRTIISLDKFIKTHTSIDVQEDLLEPIVHRVADEFFETCVKNSMIDVFPQREIDYSNYNKVSVKILKEIVETFEKYVDRYSEDIVHKKIISYFNSIDYCELINTYLEEDKKYHEYLAINKYYNKLTLKKWLEANQIKFTNSSAVDHFIARCENYSKGLGLIGLLITFDITIIDVFEHQLWLEEDSGKKTRIQNEGYYNIIEVVNFIHLNKAEEKDGIVIAFVKNAAFSHFIYANSTFVQIETHFPRRITLDEFIASYSTPIMSDKTVDYIIKALQKVVSQKQNTLIIGDVSTNKTRFLNCLVNETKHSDKIISFYENKSYKLSDDRDILQIPITNIDYQQKAKNLNKYKPQAEDYDYKFFILDNYHSISDSLLGTIMEFFQEGKGNIAVYKYSTYQDMPALLKEIELSHNLLGLGQNISFRMVDIVIVLCNFKETTIIESIHELGGDQEIVELYRHQFY